MLFVSCSLIKSIGHTKAQVVTPCALSKGTFAVACSQRVAQQHRNNAVTTTTTTCALSEGTFAVSCSQRMAQQHRKYTTTT
jgi:hypothetical protein